MAQEQFLPCRQLAYVYPVFFQDPRRTPVSEVVNQDLQDKVQAELPERYDEVGKDSMGMLA